MADPDGAPVAIASPPAASPVAAAPTSSPAPVIADPPRGLFGKRPRQDTPASPSPPASGHYAHELAATIAAPRPSSLSQERRRKEEEDGRNPPGLDEHPSHKAVNELMSGAPSDMEQIGALAAEATKALHPVTIPQPNVSDARPDASPPPSASSTAGAAELQAVMNSPGAMDVDPRDDRQSYTSQPDAQMDDKTAASFSYSGLLPPGSGTQASGAAPRCSSVPRNGEHASSSSTRKHKCPYCETEFTRHHNLKSHLLTHSQEKPYTCHECKSKFRRLHDLKRHGKLHTGEKNHQCPRCGRKFARGDALARHNKGSGGCAGRRASMGSYDGGDYDGATRNEADDAAISGVVYDGNGEMDMTEEERRRLSLPAIKAHHVGGHAENLTPNSRTYPPASRPGAPAVLYPPNADRSSLVTASSGLVNNIAGMTESPKPLSPAVPDQTQQRSPSQSNSYQPPPPQPPYTRRPSDRELPALPSLPPLHGRSAQPLMANTTVHSRNVSGPSSHANSGNSTANLFAQGDQATWSYIQQLEQHQRDLSDRLVQVENASTARDARISALESSLAQRGTKIGWLELELTSLRKDMLEYRQSQDD